MAGSRQALCAVFPQPRSESCKKIYFFSHPASDTQSICCCQSACWTASETNIAEVIRYFSESANSSTVWQQLACFQGTDCEFPVQLQAQLHAILNQVKIALSSRRHQLTAAQSPMWPPLANDRVFFGQDVLIACTRSFFFLWSYFSRPRRV